MLPLIFWDGANSEFTIMVYEFWEFFHQTQKQILLAWRSSGRAGWKCAKHQRVWNPRLRLWDQRPGGRGLVLLSSSLLNIWMFHNSKFKLIKFHLIKLKSVKPERAETWHSAQNMLIFQIMNLKFRWSYPDIDLELIELNFYTLFRYLLCEN